MWESKVAVALVCPASCRVFLIKISKKKETASLWSSLFQFVIQLRATQSWDQH